jgi:small subunit ribosomal protein S17
MADTAAKPATTHRKERTGVVVADTMDKTIVVRVQRRFRHLKYDKVITKSAKFYAHDAKNEAGVGDVVRIRETRPLSKLKRWELIQIVEKQTAEGAVEKRE